MKKKTNLWKIEPRNFFKTQSITIEVPCKRMWQNGASCVTAPQLPSMLGESTCQKVNECCKNLNWWNHRICCHKAKKVVKSKWI